MQILYRIMILTCTCTIVLLAGCKDQRRHEAGGSLDLTTTTAPVASTEAPIDVARAALTAIADAQNSRSKGLGRPEARQAYNDALARLKFLCAGKEILEQVRTTRGALVPKSIDENGAVTLMMEQWISTVAHYANGYHWDSLRLKPGPSDNIAIVYLDAANPEEVKKLAEIDASSGTAALTEAQRRDRALKMGFNIPITADIDVRLLKLANQWRVYRVDLGPAAATRPGTQPVDSSRLH
jgi:hypothetical protein